MVWKLSLTDKDSHNPDKLSRLIKKYHLPILAVHMPHSKWNVYGDDPRDILDGIVSLAGEVGAKIVTIHPERKQIPRYYSKLKRAVRTFKNSSITIAIENMPDNGLVDKQSLDTLGLVRDFGKICVDTSHLATLRLSTLNIVRQIAPHIAHVHVSDSSIRRMENGKIDDEHLPIGDGKLPIAKILSILHKANYCGCLSIELRPDLFTNLPRDRTLRIIKQSLGRVKKCSSYLGASLSLTAFTSEESVPTSEVARKLLNYTNYCISQ